jgi:hypothetical protein
MASDSRTGSAFSQGSLADFVTSAAARGPAAILAAVVGLLAYWRCGSVYEECGTRLY